jgi:hypothetical protein
MKRGLNMTFDEFEGVKKFAILCGLRKSINTLLDALIQTPTLENYSSMQKEINIEHSLYHIFCASVCPNTGKTWGETTGFEPREKTIFEAGVLEYLKIPKN